MNESGEKQPNGLLQAQEIERPSEGSESSSPTPGTPLTEAEQARQVEELLAGVGGGEPEPAAPREQSPEPASSGFDGATAEAEGQPAAPTSLAELAQKLDMDPESLYAVEVKAGDGSTATLGDLKDAWQQRETAARETAARAAELDQRESALIADQRIFAEMGDQLAQALSPETRTQLQQHLEQRTERERQAMLRTMPELAEPEAMSAFKADVTQALERYGFRPAEMQITDHRHLHILRDLIRLEKRMAQLQKWKPDAKPTKSAQPRKADAGAKAAQVMQRARRGSEADKVAGVAQILKGT